MSVFSLEPSIYTVSDAEYMSIHYTAVKFSSLLHLLPGTYGILQNTVSRDSCDTGVMLRPSGICSVVLRMIRDRLSVGRDAALPPPHENECWDGETRSPDLKRAVLPGLAGDVRIAVLDFDAKANVLRALVRCGAAVTNMRWNYDLHDKFDDLFCPIGPGTCSIVCLRCTGFVPRHTTCEALSSDLVWAVNYTSGPSLCLREKSCLIQCQRTECETV